MTKFQIIDCFLLVVLLFLLIFDIFGNRSPSIKKDELTQDELMTKRKK